LTADFFNYQKEPNITSETARFLPTRLQMLATIFLLAAKYTVLLSKRLLYVTSVNFQVYGTYILHCKWCKSSKTTNCEY